MKNLNEGLMSGHACRSFQCEVEAHYRNLEDVLVNEIYKHDIILGCVAWASSPKVVEALASKTTCLIVDRKIPRLSKEMRELYQLLSMNDKSPIYRMLRNGHGWEEYFAYSNGGKPLPYTMYGDWNFESGMWFVDGGRFRYMHHKFLLMLKEVDECTCGKVLYKPTVWTGSYNFTKNAKTGLENAVIIRNNGIAASYLGEWLEIFHNHACQLNVTDWDTLQKTGWKDTNHGYPMPLCRLHNYFPLGWFDSCGFSVVEV